MADIVVSGNSSGSVTLRAPDVSGTTILTLPTTSGTLVVSGGAQTVEFAAGSAAAPSITFTGDTNTGMFSPGADIIAFSEGGVESMRIDSSGNVGIGITTPFSKLSVSGGIASVAGANAGSGTLKLGDPTDPLPYVGVYRSAAAAINTQGNFLNLGGYDGIAFAVGPAQLSGQTERMRIDSSGNLLVGTTVNPAVNRSLGFSANAGGQGIDIYQVANTTDWAINVTTGNVINFYSDNGSALVYSGSINVGGNTTAYTSVSDYRLKENIAPLTGALAKVQSLNPVTFTFKDGGQQSQGFIAHELQSVVPDCVTGEKDAVDAEGKPVYQGIDTSFLVATLTKAIQEQQALITQLQADVAALKGAA